MCMSCPFFSLLFSLSSLNSSFSFSNSPMHSLFSLSGSLPRPSPARAPRALVGGANGRWGFPRVTVEGDSFFVRLLQNKDHHPLTQSFLGPSLLSLCGRGDGAVQYWGHGRMGGGLGCGPCGKIVIDSTDQIRGEALWGSGDAVCRVTPCSLAFSSCVVAKLRARIIPPFLIVKCTPALLFFSFRFFFC
jgi:hypothetical protein